MKIISNSKYRSFKGQKTHNNEKLVFQENRYKMQGYINP